MSACYFYAHFKSCFPQPTRLNVFKNDQDTWDYTNPNLGGPGKTLSTAKRIPEHLLRALHTWKFTSLILLSTLTATVRSFSRQASGKGTLFIDNAAKLIIEMVATVPVLAWG